MAESASALSDEAQIVIAKLKKAWRDKDLDVPMLPDVARRVLSLAEDPQSDAQQLAKLIQSDQSLAGHVMRIANSAAYSPSASLLSLQQAIARLGMNLISEIALAATINSKLFNVPGFDNHVKAVWRHALFTGFWAKEISRISRRNVEATFLCGLLHSIGRPVVLQMSIELSKRLKIEVPRVELLQIEAKFQRSFSGAVIEHWKMPELIQEAVAYCGNHKQAPTYAEQACTVAAAALFANHSLTPSDRFDDALFSHPVLLDLNLYREDIDTLVGLSERVNAQVESLSL